MVFPYLFYGLKFRTSVALDEQTFLRSIGHDQSFQIGKSFIVEKLTHGDDGRNSVDDANAKKLRNEKANFIFF